MNSEHDPDLENLLVILNDGEWHTAGEIVQAAYCMYDVRWKDRLVRRLAADSRGAIGTGQHGYKLTAAMTEDEANHAANWLDSQSEKMHDRAMEIRTAWETAQKMKKEPQLALPLSALSVTSC